MENVTKNVILSVECETNSLSEIDYSYEDENAKKMEQIKRQRDEFTRSLVRSSFGSLIIIVITFRKSVLAFR